MHMEKMSIHVPTANQPLKLVERLIKLGEKDERSVNFLLVKAIIEFLDREETKQ